MPPPRVLLLSAESPHSDSPGGIVLKRLLQDYPPERLRVVTNHPPPPGADRLGCTYVSLPLSVDRVNRTRFAGWRPALRALGASRLLATSRIDEACGGFEPEVVVTLMQDSWFYEFAARYAATRRLPLVLLVHDLAHGFETVPTWLSRRQLARDAQVFRQARVRLCISEPMAAFFRQEFGVEADVLPPPRSETPISQAPEKAGTLRHPGRLTLGYAGGLHYGYGEQLLQLLPALRAAGARLEVFCPRPAGAVAALADATDVIHFHGHAPRPEDAWRGLLARCDVLLQPYLNPPGPHARQYRTHFPSKLGDALSLGLPLLLTGPGDASGVRWCAARPGCALAITEPGDAPFLAALQRLRDDAELRVSLATGAQAAAAELSAPKLRHDFSAALQRALAR